MQEEWIEEEVLSLCRGYQAACLLAAAADLDLFTLLDGEPLTVEEAAERIEADPRALGLLLNALVGQGLLRKQGGRYHVPEPVARVLSAGRGENALPMVQHQAACLRRWVQLPHVVKKGGPAAREPGLRGAAAEHHSFIQAMNYVSRSAAADLIAALESISFDCLLDVGGASGTWTRAWLKTRPQARAFLFDLPEVIPLARERLEREGLLDRVELFGGNYLEDPLPAGADLAWVSAIIHQNSSAENRLLFRRIADSLVPGGRVLIRDIVMEEDKTAPASGAMFALNMLVGTPAGGTYSFSEIRADLESAGFEEVALLRRDRHMNSIVGASKPEKAGAAE